MELFSSLEKLLKISNPEKKCVDFQDFYEKYKNGELEENHNGEVQSFETPSYKEFLEILLPSKVNSRKKLNRVEGQASLLHAIIHIEYSAIDLALDHAYRFRDLPKEYYDDWLEVADDEVRHFLMLISLLKELGYKYGDFPVHDSLFLASKNSESSLVSRMSVVPRYLEASGLDSNPLIIEKLNSLNTPFTRKFVSALEIILKEEVEHVRKGDKWFHFACRESEIDTNCYFHIVKEIYPKAFQNGKLNREARKKAGFTTEEIEIASGETSIPHC